MKLSEILGWKEKNWGSQQIGWPEGFNEALTSCDREIDREALAKDIKASRSMYRWEIRDKQIGDDIQDEDEFIATSIISTMPKWLKRIEEDRNEDK